jgi:hypothetical protein
MDMSITYRQRILILVSLLVVISTSTTSLSFYYVYQVGLEEQAQRMIEMAKGQARLIEAVARFDVAHNDGQIEKAFQATLSQIVEGHQYSTGLGVTGEIVLGRLEGNTIKFMLNRRHNMSGIPESITTDSEVALPMRLALSGESGHIIGLDYRGETVFSAYEPVAELEMGIVAKIDLAEIRAPYIRVGLICGGVMLGLLIGGSVLYMRIGSPLVNHLVKSNRLYLTLSQVNQSLLIARDREELFQHICDLVVGNREFRLAWVGLYDDEPLRICGCSRKDVIGIVARVDFGRSHGGLFCQSTSPG